MTNFGMLSMRLNRNSAAKRGKQWRSIPVTSSIRGGLDFSVSRSASGMLSSTRDATATTAMATEAKPRLRVRKSATEKTAATATERSAWLMPAR